MGTRFLKRFFRLFNLGNLIAITLLVSILGSGVTVNAQNASTPSLTLTVTNASEDLNGDISSPTALLANPGADGISLPEALSAMENTGAYETINFTPSLKGAIIHLTQTLPAIVRNGLTLDGDIDGDGVPDITIDGSGKGIQALQIQGASHVVIEGLHISNFGAPDIEISTIPQQDVHLVEDLSLRHNILTNCGSSAISIVNHQNHAVIRNIVISDNTLQNNHFGITLTGGFTSDENDNEISNVSILSNTLTASGLKADIFITSTAGENVSRNTIKDIEIRGNHISDHADPPILISAANSPNSNDNLVSNITITENKIDGTPVTMELLSVGGGPNAARNTLSNVIITDNILSGGGIQFSGATGTNAHDNTISEVLIDRNHISSCAANGISLYAGSDGAHDNLLENVILRNTFIGNCHDAGVLLHGDDGSSRRNVISNVTITNLTLVNNGDKSLWAGGLNINTLDSSNTITGVSVANTILWYNGGKDSIQGSLTPASVTYSILYDTRFVDKNGNFYQDPKFLDPTSGNFHLQSTSPCINSGDPSAANIGTLDLDKNPRVWEGNGGGLSVVDQGAYELNISVPPKPTVQANGSHLGWIILLAIGIILVLEFFILKKRR